ncbi:MAG: M48 family metalloprotease [Candidatus Aminicenantes bacterium]|nr:M48 family metalloprotease [Candidatus Aminicenantes bacterium]
MKTNKVWIPGCLVLALLAACAVNPVTGKRELSLISEQQELQLGAESDAQIRGQYGIYQDAALESYITKLGRALVPHSHRPQLPYHFAVIDDPVVNAFAAPGGYVYLTRGILAMAGSEAEIVSVLGHELGHINARHSVRRMSQAVLTQIGLGLGSILSEDFAKVSGLAGVGAQLLFLKYSRDDERQADALGVQYARSAGYNPAGMVAFFESLERLGDLSGKGSLPGFLSTHPLTKERIQTTKAMLTADDAGRFENRDLYLKAVDNIVYGDDPRQGYVEANAFYHPDMAFTFSFPAGWKLQNTAAQVVLTSPQEDCAFWLQAEKSAEDLSAYARKKLAGIEGGTLLQDQSFKINGLASYHQTIDVTGQGQQQTEATRARLSYIRKADFIYTCGAAAALSTFSRRDPEFSRIVKSFETLRDRTKLDRRPKRLKIMKGDGRRTLEAIFQAEGVAKDLWPTLAVMNALPLNQTPAAGRPVKVVR